MRNALIIAVALALLAPTAVAFHRSVGGDVSANFTPAGEYLLNPPRDVTGEGAGAKYLADDYVTLGTDGRISYVNTLDPALAASMDRVAPLDQSYEAGSGVGYFDVIYVNYAGALQLTRGDPIASTLEGNPGHSMTTSPNVFYSLPPLTTVNDVAPGTVGAGDSGVWYPTAGYFYAYLFGDGNSEDADGNPLVAGEGPFAGLISPDACAPRATQRCQLFSPADLEALVADDSSGRQAAICGYNPVHQLRANANVAACRDFDFGFVTNNPDEWGGQAQPSSPTWVYNSVPGWFGNKAAIPAREIHSAGGSIGGGNQWNYFTQPLVMHFTVGAAFDPEFVAAGGLSDPWEGVGPLSCVEPGFDVNNYVAHDLDIYHPPNTDVAATGRDVEAIVDQVTDALGPVGDIVDPIVDQVVDTANDAIDQGADFVIESRTGPGYYDEDTHRELEVVFDSRLECRNPDNPNQYQKKEGKVMVVDGETIWNDLRTTVWQDLGVVGLAPFKDPVESLNAEDDHENAGGSVQFYFNGAVQEASSEGGGSDVDLQWGFYDTEVNSGDQCITKGTFTDQCEGDWMADNGYADPTALVFVHVWDGPVNFLNWDDFTGFIYASQPSAGRHCAIGAAKHVFDPATGQTLKEPQVFDAVLARVAPGESLDGLTQDQMKQKLMDTVCRGADTLDYFPGPGFRANANGGGFGTGFGWESAPAWGGAAEGTLDVFYVLSVDADGGLSQDKLDLDSKVLGDPTVVDADGSAVTFVWQEHTEMGTQA